MDEEEMVRHQAERETDRKVSIHSAPRVKGVRERARILTRLDPPILSGVRRVSEACTPSFFFAELLGKAPKLGRYVKRYRDFAEAFR
jgi:hypothetical protein